MCGGYQRLETLVLKVDSTNPDPEVMRRAAEILRRGGLVAFPTETVYGLAGDATSGVTWQAVACPASGNIVALYNNGYAGQIYFQNVVFPVASAVAGGHTGTQMFGYWDFGTAVAGQSVTLTDTLGHVVTGTIPGSSGGSVGAQFPTVCQ